MIRQLSPEWFEARRQGITSTDMVAILGLDKYRSEGDVAREKLGQDRPESDPASERRMRLGREMENLIKGEDEIEHGIKLRRVSRLITHPEIPWALTSLDFERIGERTIVETKASSSRKWDDGLPESVEVQVRWQMGVARYPRVHIAALRYGNSLACFDLEHDEATFERMVVIGRDFMHKVDALRGVEFIAAWPFSENKASVRRAYPLDDGTAIEPDPELDGAIRNLIATRKDIGILKDKRDALEEAIQTRMGPAALVQGSDYRVTWRRARESTSYNFERLARDTFGSIEDFPKALPDYIETRPGSRRFIVREERQDDE